MATSDRMRLLAAALVVAAGLAAVTPSLAPDSDRDGVGDVVEVYELGTDPSSADEFDTSEIAKVRGRAPGQLARGAATRRH